jgi:hypothetical protein
MSGDKYSISDKSGCYFVTFTVIHWIDIFSRKEYRDIIVDSLAGQLFINYGKTITML